MTFQNMDVAKSLRNIRYLWKYQLSFLTDQDTYRTGTCHWHYLRRKPLQIRWKIKTDNHQSSEFRSSQAKKSFTKDGQKRDVSFHGVPRSFVPVSSFVTGRISGLQNLKKT
jgi:hypothetical protein